MSLAIIHKRSNAGTGAKGMIEVTGYRFRSDILEQFTVRPLHRAFTKKRIGRLPGATQSFQQEQGIRKLLTHSCDDVLPHVCRNFVSRVTTKTIDAAPAPNEKNLCQIIP